MTTIHSYTGDQPTLDTMHKDLYRGRAAGVAIPTTTGAATCGGPRASRARRPLDGVAIRVPTPNVSCVDLTFEAARATSVEEINAAVAAAADGPLGRVLSVTTRELVSSDFNHNAASSVFATDQTRVMEGGTMCRVLAWYDNEWGFSCRMADVAARMAALS